MCDLSGISGPACHVRSNWVRVFLEEVCSLNMMMSYSAPSPCRGCSCSEYDLYMTSPSFKIEAVRPLMGARCCCCHRCRCNKVSHSCSPPPPCRPVVSQTLFLPHVSSKNLVEVSKPSSEVWPWPLSSRREPLRFGAVVKNQMHMPHFHGILKWAVFALKPPNYRQRPNFYRGDSRVECWPLAIWPLLFPMCHPQAWPTFANVFLGRGEEKAKSK